MPAKAWKKLRRDPVAWFGLAIWGSMIFLAVAAPLLPLQNVEAMHLDETLQPPSKAAWLGKDSFGRDNLSRMIYGARVSVSVGAVSVGIALVLGVTAGMAAGYFGGLVDSVVMRIMDAILAFPSILLAVALVGSLGPSTRNVAIALAVTSTPRYARITRSSVLAASQMEYVQAAEALGADAARIMWRHILPNVSGPLIVQATASYAYAIIAEAGLSFLGLGAQPPTPSWGGMVADARRYLTTHIWYAMIPCVVIAISVLGITLLGDRLRQALDPQQS